MFVPLQEKSPCSTNFYKKGLRENEFTEFRGNSPGPWGFIPSNQSDPLSSVRDVVAVLTRFVRISHKENVLVFTLAYVQTSPFPLLHAERDVCVTPFLTVFHYPTVRVLNSA